MTTIPARLAARFASDPTQPIVTFYDDASGERVELSVTSFGNWVAKTANLLRDGLGAEPGERLALALPTHWLGPVWLCAAWACGLEVLLDPVGSEPNRFSYAVTGPNGVDRLGELASEQTVAVSLRPLGGRFTDPLPAGVLDYAAEVPSYADFFGESLAVPLRARWRPAIWDMTRRPLSRGGSPRLAISISSREVGCSPTTIRHHQTGSSSPGWHPWSPRRAWWSYATRIPRSWPLGVSRNG